MNAIAERPPKEMYASGLEIDCQCARCGSSCTDDNCGDCGGEGYVSRYDEDPLWYDEDDLYPCHWCNGVGVFHSCCSSPDWCNANPMPCREEIKRGAIEWFTIGTTKATP